MIDIPPGQLVNLLGSLLLVALGAWVVWIRPTAPTNRLLAAYCLGFAGWTIGTTLTMGQVVTDPALVPSILVAGGAMAALGGASIVGLAFLQPGRLRSDEQRLTVIAALLVGLPTLAIVVNSLNEIEQGAQHWGVASATNVFWVFVVGWALFFAGTIFTLMLMAFRFRSLVRRHGPAARHAAQLSIALAVFPGLNLGINWFARDGIHWFASPAWIAVLAIVAATWLWNTRFGAPRLCRAASWTPLAFALAGMSIAAISGQHAPSITTGISGVARTIAAVYLVYAILRDQLFDIDLKIKWTLNRSTIAAAFVAVFLIATEGAQVVFGERNPWLGIGAAAILVFAMAPLQRFADRLSDGAMPNVRDDDEYRRVRKEEVFRATLVEMLVDGNLTAKERRALLRLQEQLGLDAATAQRVEIDILDAREAA